MEQPPRSTLGSRFYALPSELRAHIFSFLFVRPVQWDSLHLESCEKWHARSTSEYIRPTQHSIPEVDSPYVCASCGLDTYEHNWRHAFKRGFKVYVSPWRSKWAPPQDNPYICSNCYDDRWRVRPFPEPTNLPCLCARHQSLETRLVCRGWNDVCSIVLFSRNTFAFDDCISMGNFFSAIPKRWKVLVTSISLLLPLWHPGDGPASVKAFPGSLSILNDLTWLRDLELDAKLLNHESRASALLDCSIAGLQTVRFVIDCPQYEVLWRSIKPPTRVWNELHGRVLLVGGFSEFVVPSMKSQFIYDVQTQALSIDVQIRRRLYNLIQDDHRLWHFPALCKDRPIWARNRQETWLSEGATANRSLA
jgi:hypothetical protein